MIVGIDMSTTNTGVSVFNPKTNKMIHYELISPKDKNFMIRCIKIVNRIIEICKEYKPSRVQFEDVQMRFNRAGYTLSFAQGALVFALELYGFTYIPIPINVWRKEIGIKSRKRDEQKQEALNKVKELFGIETDSDDIAEAVLISTFNNVR